MNRFATRSATFAATAGIALILALDAKPVVAQSLYLPTGSYTANDATYSSFGSGIYVGEDSSKRFADPNTGNPYVATLNVVNGGNVGFANSYNTSTTSIAGGNVGTTSGYNDSTTNITSGNVNAANGFNNSTTNISNIGILYANGYNFAFRLKGS